MDDTEQMNERVEVVAAFYTDMPEARVAVPRKMLYKGREIIFTEFGLRHPTSKGQRMVHVFDVSDGSNDYRLEFDAARLVWYLTAMRAGDI
jgi:hypothetical protein